MCVCMVITYIIAEYGMGQPGKVANPARGQLNKEKMSFSLSPFVPENMVSREGFGRPARRQPRTQDIHQTLQKRVRAKNN